MRDEAAKSPGAIFLFLDCDPVRLVVGVWFARDSHFVVEPRGNNFDEDAIALAQGDAEGFAAIEWARGKQTLDVGVYERGIHSRFAGRNAVLRICGSDYLPRYFEGFVYRPNGHRHDYTQLRDF